MRVLVLGGTRFVGRGVVEAGLARGDEVSTLNRGKSGVAAEGVHPLIADRTDPAAMRRAIGDREWDVAVDTWTGPPRVVRDSCALLTDRVGHYAYISSWVVYRPPVPPGADERAEVIGGDPDDAADGFYPATKRGGELAVMRAFGARALLARCGPTLGPHEDVGSFTWWLGRIRSGGQVLAPGAPTDPLQYVDVRDLAAWVLHAARRGVGGAFNAVCPRGRHDMNELLATMCQVTKSDARLVWAPDDVLVSAGVRPYLDIPLWLPATLRGGLNDVDSSAAHHAGLDTSRPLHESLADTWSWLESEGESAGEGTRRGLDPAVEQRLLADLT